MKYEYSRLAALAVIALVSINISFAGILCRLDLADYEAYAHDSKAATVAVQVTKEGGGGGGGVITACSIVLFDNKGQQKLSVPFNQALGGTKVQVEHFEKTWVILKVEGDTNFYYSVKLGKSGAVILGSSSDDDMSVRYAYKKVVVSYKNSDKQCQLYDQELQPTGTPVTLLGKPQPLNGGAYFYCEGDDKTEIYRVKKSLEKIVTADGDYNAVNEAKRLCCIKKEEDHTLVKY
jgi:hypothetical protein